MDLTIIAAQIDSVLRPRSPRVRRDKPGRTRAAPAAAETIEPSKPVRMKKDRSVVLDVKDAGDRVVVFLVPTTAALSLAPEKLAAAAALAQGAVVDVVHRHAVVASTDPARIKPAPRRGTGAHGGRVRDVVDAKPPDAGARVPGKPGGG